MVVRLSGKDAEQGGVGWSLGCPLPAEGLSMAETAELCCDFNEQLAAAGAYNPIYA